jgi:hypothetical protein
VCIEIKVCNVGLTTLKSRTLSVCYYNNMALAGLVFHFTQCLELQTSLASAATYRVILSFRGSQPSNQNCELQAHEKQKSMASLPTTSFPMLARMCLPIGFLSQRRIHINPCGFGCLSTSSSTFPEGYAASTYSSDCRVTMPNIMLFAQRQQFQSRTVIGFLIWIPQQFARTTVIPTVHVLRTL